MFSDPVQQDHGTAGSVCLPSGQHEGRPQRPRGHTEWGPCQGTPRTGMGVFKSSAGKAQYMYNF